MHPDTTQPQHTDRKAIIIKPKYAKIAIVVFLLCFIGSAITMVAPVVDVNDINTAEMTILAFVAVFFVLIPLISIVHVLRSKPTPPPLPVEPGHLAPTTVVEPLYYDYVLEDQQFKKLKSDTYYKLGYGVCTIFGLVFTAVGLSTMISGNIFFGIPFSLFGVGALGVAIWSILQIMLVGKTTVKASTDTPIPGEPVTIHVSHSRPLKIRELQVDLVLREFDSQGEGTSIKVLEEYPLARLQDVEATPDKPLVRIQVTPAAANTPLTKGKWIKHYWHIRVKMDLPGMKPHRKEHFQLMQV